MSWLIGKGIQVLELAKEPGDRLRLNITTKKELSEVFLAHAKFGNERNTPGAPSSIKGGMGFA